MDSEIKAIVNVLELVPHPKGGYYREPFRSSLMLGGLPHGAPRNASTAIYFLLPVGTFSAFHRVKNSDEVWHHYSGDPVELHMIDGAGNYSRAILGQDLTRGERPQIVVPANSWQAAVPVGSRYALCGCTVAPGFDFVDFEMLKREELLKLFPQHQAVIEKLTRV